MTPLYRTCDLCRKRKTKCAIPEGPEGEPSASPRRCNTCVRAGEECTFLNGYRKPGRPPLPPRNDSGSASVAPQQHRARFEDPVTQELPHNSAPHHPPSNGNVLHAEPLPILPSIAPQTKPQSAPAPDPPSWAAPSPRPHSAQNVISNMSNSIDFDFDFDPAGPPTWSSSGSLTHAPVNAGSGSAIPDNFFDGSMHSQQSPSKAQNHTERFGEFARFEAIPITSTMPLDDVVPWSAISNIVASFLVNLHSLFPLVHKPTFSTALAMRKDRTDRTFGALVLGIVAYTIGQSPLSRLVKAGDYTRQELYWIQRRCHAASMVKISRRYRKLSVNQIAVLMCGHFFCKSLGETNQAASILAEACQLVHLLCIQSAEDDDIDPVERELRRRLFWHVHAVDATEATAGHVIHMNAFEGMLPLPLAIDDELLTIHGAFEPPPGTRSALAGFVVVMQLFPDISDCVARHRSLRQRRLRGSPLTPEETSKELAWIAAAREVADARIQDLPAYLKVPAPTDEGDDDWKSVAGMHRANIWVTHTSLKFSLLAYAEELDIAAEEIIEERARVERSVFQILSSLPLDALAANGESMRGKIFRIILDILRGNNPAEVWISPMSDWCDLYSRIQFVQLNTTDLTSLFPSRPQSPVCL